MGPLKRPLEAAGSLGMAQARPALLWQEEFWSLLFLFASGNAAFLTGCFRVLCRVCKKHDTVALRREPSLSLSCHFHNHLHYWQGQGSAGWALFAWLAPWELDLQAWVLHGGRFLPIISLLQPRRIPPDHPFRYSQSSLQRLFFSHLLLPSRCCRRDAALLQGSCFCRGANS